MPTERPIIERLELAGYKSIRQASIDLTRLNVLIGSNGAGKSNLVSFFAMLSAALGNKRDEYVGRHGGPNALFHLGAKHTSEIAAAITMKTDLGHRTLETRFGFRAPDGLNFYGWLDKDTNRDLENSQYKESGYGYIFLYHIRILRDRQATYHLDDTSLTAPIRLEDYIQDNQRLHSDARNLAAILYLYKTRNPKTYQRIRSTVRMVAPSFDDFALEPQRLNPNNILLNWRQQGSDYLFGPHQVSDGTLRAMALITLFLQPEEDLPDLLIVDEPELGLHPYALTIVAGLIRAASVQTQVIVTTQSTAFLDQFGVDEIIVVDSEQGASQFRRLDPEQLKDWLEEYSVGELWQKNVIGGGPMP
jgi:predicted ATPase